MSDAPPYKSSLATQVDELIDFYENHGRPGAGMRIPVYATPLQLATVTGYPMPPVFPVGYKLPREYNYRGRVLVSISNEGSGT